jgi:hypothetical protein
LMETGEVPTTEGQPSGREAGKTPERGAGLKAGAGK